MCPRVVDWPHPVKVYAPASSTAGVRYLRPAHAGALPSPANDRSSLLVRYSRTGERRSALACADPFRPAGLCAREPCPHFASIAHATARAVYVLVERIGDLTVLADAGPQRGAHGENHGSSDDCGEKDKGEDE